MDLGVSWSGIAKRSKIIYLICGFLLLSLIISSYFVMKDIKYFALITNIHFGLITPVYEELLFRGYGWEKLKKENYSQFKICIITTLLFAIFHIGYYFQISYATQFHPDAPSLLSIMFQKVIYAAILGFIMGLIKWKSNRVFGSIIVHAILNIIGK